MKNILIVILVAAAAIYLYFSMKKPDAQQAPKPASQPDINNLPTVEATIVPLAPNRALPIGMQNWLAAQTTPYLPTMVATPPTANPILGVVVNGYDGTVSKAAIKLPWWMKTDKPCNSGICLYNKYYPGCTHCLYKSQQNSPSNN
jgi:hypothetical protein